MRAVTLAILITVGLTGGASLAEEADGFTIQAGAVHPTQPAKAFEYTRFYPTTLQVHRGQTVTWKIVGGSAGGTVGFHTVTFMPADGPERPGFLRADELPEYPNLVERWWQPSGCGQASQSPCLLSGANEFHSSGIPPLNPGLRFSVTADAPVGVYGYVCTVHPSMKGLLEVVDDEVPLLSQSEIDAQTAVDIAADTASAEAIENQDPGFTIDGDRRVWNVLLGDSTPDNHVAVNQYIPASLDIEVGDGIRFASDVGVVDEVHTVSFPSEHSGDFSLGGLGIPWGKAGFGFHPRCDVDDPFTGAPGVPGLFGVTPLPCPGVLEFGAAPWMTRPQPAPGNAVLPGGIHDSALLVPVGAPDDYRRLPGADAFMPSTFEAEFPTAGTFVYECNVHSDPMVGSVTVS